MREASSTLFLQASIPAGLVEQRLSFILSVRLWEKPLAQVCAQMRLQAGRAAVQFVTEYPLAFVDRTPGIDPLGTLTGKQQGQIEAILCAVAVALRRRGCRAQPLRRSLR